MASRSLVDSAALVKKVRFPRQLVPLSVVATQLVTFVAMLAVLIVVNLIVIPETRDTFLLSTPALARASSRSSAGSRSTVACANVVFRDVEHLVSAVLLPWFFLTPILYRLEDLPGGFKRYDWVVTILRWVNPLTPPIYALRDPLFYGRLPARLGRRLPLRRGGDRARPRRVGLQPRRRPDRGRALAVAWGNPWFPHGPSPCGRSCTRQHARSRPRSSWCRCCLAVLCLPPGKARLRRRLVTVSSIGL